MPIVEGPGPGAATARPRARQAPNPQGEIDALLSTLFGGGGTSDLTAAISDSYDGQIAAYDDLLGTLGTQQQELVGNIRNSAAQTNQQVGGFFDYAAQQAQAGRAPIEQVGVESQANVDAIYDDLASTLAAQPQQSVARASEAAGGAVGGSVAGRVAAATAPFEAAGETSRANAKANLTQHSAAGQDYLSQLASAAPSEAAMNQAAITAQANNAVTESEMAMAQQRAEISAQTAALEGAKQRALIEHSADMAGSTFERLMQTTSLFNALGADTSPIRDSLGLEADPTGGMSYEDTLDIATKEARLEQMLAGEDPMAVGGDQGFNLELEDASPSTQKVGNALREYAEANELGIADINELLSPGEDGRPLNPQMEALLEELTGGFTAYSPNELKSAFRAWYQ